MKRTRVGAAPPPLLLTYQPPSLMDRLPRVIKEFILSFSILKLEVSLITGELKQQKNHSMYRVNQEWKSLTPRITSVMATVSDTSPFVDWGTKFAWQFDSLQHLSVNGQDIHVQRLLYGFVVSIATRATLQTVTRLTVNIGRAGINPKWFSDPECISTPNGGSLHAFLKLMPELRSFDLTVNEPGLKCGLSTYNYELMAMTTAMMKRSCIYDYSRVTESIPDGHLSEPYVVPALIVLQDIRYYLPRKRNTATFQKITFNGKEWKKRCVSCTRPYYQSEPCSLSKCLHKTHCGQCMINASMHLPMGFSCINHADRSIHLRCHGIPTNKLKCPHYIHNGTWDHTFKSRFLCDECETSESTPPCINGGASMACSDCGNTSDLCYLTQCENLSKCVDCNRPHRCPVCRSCKRHHYGDDVCTYCLICELPSRVHNEEKNQLICKCHPTNDYSDLDEPEEEVLEESESEDEEEEEEATEECPDCGVDHSEHSMVHCNQCDKRLCSTCIELCDTCTAGVCEDCYYLACDMKGHKQAANEPVVCYSCVDRLKTYQCDACEASREWSPIEITEQ